VAGAGHCRPVAARRGDGTSGAATGAARDRRRLIARRLPPVWAILSAAWLAPALLAVCNAYAQSRLYHEPANARSLVWQGADWLLYGAVTPFVYQLARRFPIRQHLALHAVASVISCAAWAGAGAVLRRLIIPGPEGALTGQFVISWFFITLPFGVAVYFAVVGAERAVFYFFESTEARLAALRAQLNPHFLFNSLNAVGVLIRDRDPDTASRVIEELGAMLHELLKADAAHEITLAEELAFLDRYLAVEQIRFSDRLRPTFDVDANTLGAAVPHLVLQPLVENALRHGIARRADAGHVHVAGHRVGDDLVLAVTDDGPGVVSTKSGVGLSNIRARLATLHGRRGQLDLVSPPGGGTVATVRLPYRELSRA
jgi:two-component system, LytTR family, sensor kinase